MKKLRFVVQASLMLVVLVLLGGEIHEHTMALPPELPCGTYTGTVIDTMDSLDNWTSGSGRGGKVVDLTLVPGYLSDQAIQLSYRLRKRNGAWVQIRRNFPEEEQLDLSTADHLR